MSGDTSRTDERWTVLEAALWNHGEARPALDSLRAEVEQTERERDDFAGQLVQARTEYTALVAERDRVLGMLEANDEKWANAVEMLSDKSAQLEQTQAELRGTNAGAEHLRAEVEQTKKERDEFKDFWENATDLAAEARAEVEQLRAALREGEEVLTAMGGEGWPPPRLAPRLWRLRTLFRRALTTHEDR